MLFTVHCPDRISKTANKMIAEPFFSVKTHMGHFSLKVSHMEISQKDVFFCYFVLTKGRYEAIILLSAVKSVFEINVPTGNIYE